MRLKISALSPSQGMINLDVESPRVNILDRWGGKAFDPSDVTGVEVEGNCCWSLFPKTWQRGETQILIPGYIGAPHFVPKSMKTSVTPQSVTPQSVTPQSVTPQSVTPQSVTPQSVTPQSVTPQSVTPQSVTPQSVTPQSVTPKSVTPKSVTPKSVTPKSVTPKSVTPKSVTPKSVTPKSVTPKSVTPKSVTPKSVTPKSVTPKSVTPKSVTPKSVTPKSVALKSTVLFRVLCAKLDFDRLKGDLDTLAMLKSILVSSLFLGNLKVIEGAEKCVKLSKCEIELALQNYRGSGALSSAQLQARLDQIQCGSSEPGQEVQVLCKEYQDASNKESATIIINQEIRGGGIIDTTDLGVGSPCHGSLRIYYYDQQSQSPEAIKLVTGKYPAVLKGRHGYAYRAKSSGTCCWILGAKTYFRGSRTMLQPYANSAEIPFQSAQATQ
eukprot:maker-scaffold130_size324016-snap-gene-1.13 protein:Tk07100 transcript:maker-scaffold130_size324016-snap-gene-1.13-mRNA-1 annotation:"a2 protein"